MLTLSNIQQKFSNKKLLLAFAIILIFLIFLMIRSLIPPRFNVTSQNAPAPALEQPVVNGKFDSQAEISQRSKAALEKLKGDLPYRKIITTSTGQKVTFALFFKPLDEYTLYVETIGINFQSNYDDPSLANNVQDFRDTAALALGFVESKGVDPHDLFISWGGQSYVQKNAKDWLVESPQYPKVVKDGDLWKFESEPVK